MPRLTSREKQQRKDIARLKRLGLYKPKAPMARNVPVTSHATKVIRKYRDVLAGRATVVKAKGGEVHVASDIRTRAKITKRLSAAARAKYYSGILRVKGDRIVVSQGKEAKPRFDKKSGEITIDVKNVGEIKRGRVVPIRIQDIDDLRRIESAGFVFGLPLRKFGSNTIDWQYYEDVDELIQDITKYYRNKKLARYVVLIPKSKGKMRASSRIAEDEDNEGDE